MPKKLEAAERIILLTNRRVRRLGGWNAAVVMAAIAAATRRKRGGTMLDIEGATDLSAGVIHRLLRKLSVAGLVDYRRRGNKFSRKLSAKGADKLRSICRF